MTRVLLTAFEPYGPWRTNASWLTLVALTRDLPSEPSVTTRLYPVDYESVRERLTSDLAGNYDFVILTGQAPGRTRLELETVALNLATNSTASVDAPRPLLVDGPLAYNVDLPAEMLCEQIRTVGIPAAVSRHAGTYLCNASLYYALHEITQRNLATRALFIHLPLDPSQAARHADPVASQSADVSARALRVILEGLTRLNNRAEA